MWLGNNEFHRSSKNRIIGFFLIFIIISFSRISSVISSHHATMLLSLVSDFSTLSLPASYSRWKLFQVEGRSFKIVNWKRNCGIPIYRSQFRGRSYELSRVLPSKPSFLQMLALIQLEHTSSLTAPTGSCTSTLAMPPKRSGKACVNSATSSFENITFPGRYHAHRQILDTPPASIRDTMPVGVSFQEQCWVLV